MNVAAERPPLRRDPTAGVIAGVCAGAGRALGVDPIVLRLALVAATAAGGLGVVVYALGWALIPAEGDAVRKPPRVSAATFQTVAGVACLTLAAMLGVREIGWWIGDALVWPIVLAASGAALVWRQSVRRAPVVEAPKPRAGPPRTEERAVSLARLGAGIALIFGAGLLFLYANGVLDSARDEVVTVVVVIVALGLVLAPVWWRLVRNLTAERAARIRSQERTEVGAHLHDSVLQTLALIQRRADDPRAVATLARSQERELRSWLSGAAPARPDARLADALLAAAAEVEHDHGVAVDVVTVGDRELDEPGHALVDAAREAIVNAAKHAGAAGPVSVYAEAAGDGAQVFVRDRGGGFDPDAVPGDRRGVRESIIGRMRRHGGRATVSSSPQGTEVELWIA